MSDIHPVPEAPAEANATAPDRSGGSDSRAIDWFGLTESNLPSNGVAKPPAQPPAPAPAPELEGPGFASIGGLKP